MSISSSEKSKIKDFVKACNEMIGGRFILSDIKIARILECIASSEILYNLFAKCLINFNFRQEFKSALSTNKVNGGYFVLPNEQNKIVALVFCLLIEVDNQKINLQSFINDNFFSPDGYNISYSNFAHNVLIPFKSCVLMLLNVNEDGEALNEEDNTYDAQVSIEDVELDATSKLLFANLTRAVNDLCSAVRRKGKLKKEQKEEIIIIAKAMNEAIKLENFKILNALIIPLEYILGKDKVLKNYYNDVKESLIKLYN
ncbi:MAG: hypothetical protein E7359_04635 [Clostridiales bacterium]|nr:hypothetical protein [Clostridiales bacterium]